jgi:hypothetical protein
VNDHVIPPNRRPIVIADSLLSAGGATTSVRADDPEALLREYLRLIRRVRNQQRDRSVALRRTDIDTLADHLGWTNEQVLARLADLMGATRRQRATMLAVLATGAALITVSSPFAAAAADAGKGSIAHSDPPIVVSAEHLSVPRHTPPARPAARVMAPDAIVRDVVNESRDARHAPVLEVQLERDAAPQPSALHDFAPTDPEIPSHTELAGPAALPGGAHDQGDSGRVAHPDVVESVPVTEPEPQVAVGRPPVPPAIDDAGNQVAVGQPPVPPTTDTGIGTDDAGNQVAVGQPPVPPTTDTGTDDAGNQVAVGQPPVPPTTDTDTGTGTGTGTDDAGNQVAVGQPPVPPSEG